MNFKIQLTGCYTIVHREMYRMLRIFSQTFFPPVIVSILYFLIFGDILAERIGPIGGHSYATFIAPGLITLGVINNAYANVSSSLFSMRFQRSIEEILISPVHWSTMLLGFVIGGVVRGVGVALLITAVASFFVSLHIFDHVLSMMLLLLLISTTLSLAGFLNGMIARTFDDVAFIPTFVLTPLIYLGGVFYTTKMLPSIFQHITYLNPIYYMVHALRYIMLNQTDGSFVRDILVMSLICGILLLINAICIKRGIGFRD